jgi:hypothetical protein
MSREIKIFDSSLIIVEGATELAFVEFLQNCRGRREDFKRFTIKNANGGAPKKILERAISTIGEFNKKCIVFDTDVLTNNPNERAPLIKRARQNRIQIIEMDPDFDSVILDALNIKRVAGLNAKELLAKELQGRITFKETYQNYFSNKILLDVIAIKPSLVQLCELFDLS